MIRRKIRQCLALRKTKQKREKRRPGAYRMFLLDLDATYGQEEADSYGVEPVLYLLLDPKWKAEQIAIRAVHPSPHTETANHSLIRETHRTNQSQYVPLFP